MDVVGPKISAKLGSGGDKRGIPVVAIIGLPLLALLSVLFLGFGFALKRQQADLTKTYFERTAEFLARDLADQLGQLFTPAAEYADKLAATLAEAKCATDECVFAILRMQRAIADRIPQQVAYVLFGDRTGRRSCAERPKALNRRGPVQRQAQFQRRHCPKSARPHRTDWRRHRRDWE
jgi:hypothetical protein